MLPSNSTKSLDALIHYYHWLEHQRCNRWLQYNHAANKRLLSGVNLRKALRNTRNSQFLNYSVCHFERDDASACKAMKSLDRVVGDIKVLDRVISLAFEKERETFETRLPSYWEDSGESRSDGETTKNHDIFWCKLSRSSHLGFLGMLESTGSLIFALQCDGLSDAPINLYFDHFHSLFEANTLLAAALLLGLCVGDIG